MKQLRRLVNLHTTGKYAGIAHIHGVECGPTPAADSEMPVAVDVQMLDGKFRACTLVRANERAVFYREQA
jgi:hypothetical protein